ncbi:MAG: alkaline phosphatase family protein [Acidobacteriota bacterium]
MRPHWPAPPSPRLASTRIGAALLLTCFGAVAAAEPPASPAPPRLLVIVSVDGLSWARLAIYRPWYTAGLKRLLDEGQVETECRYRHLNTETGPGHASLGTGAPPRVTGIVTNAWFEKTGNGPLHHVSCTDQAAPGVPGFPPMFYREVEKEGRLYVFAFAARLATWQDSGALGTALLRTGFGPNREGVTFDSEDAIWLYDFRHRRRAEPFVRGTMPGPGNLRIPTLGDRLVASRPGARVVSISGKDRGAIFLAGHDPGEAVYWFDQDSGRFVTSAAYGVTTRSGARVATLVDGFNRTQAGGRLPQRFGLLWRKLPLSGPAPAAWPTPVPDLRDFQVPVEGLGFDHDLAGHPNGYFSGIYVSPLIDQLVADLAVVVIEDPGLQLGQGVNPDLLALSFSAQDTVSHNYGPESEENLDVLRRLDLQLGRVLDALDSRVGKARIALAFSADHGFAMIPEALKRREATFTGGRLVTGGRTTHDFVERLNRRLDDALCLDPASRPVAAVETWSVYYNRPALPLRTVAGACGAAGREVGTREIDAALPSVVGQTFGEQLQGVLLTSRIASWPGDDPNSEFARNDYDPERSGEAFLVPRSGVLMHRDPGRGTGHGTQHEPDIHVPLIFWGGAFTAGAAVRPSTPYDLAPTLARLVGVSLPDATGTARTP